MKTTHQIILFMILLVSIKAKGQGVGIGTTAPDPSAKLEINSTTQGTLITRMSTAQRNAIVSPAEGLLIFNTDSKCFESYVYSAWYSVSCPCPLPAAVSAGIHSPSQIQIVWNWNAVSGATGYKWNTLNDYSTALDNQNTTSYTQTGLSCGMQDSIFVWAYNTCGSSPVSILTQSTSPCNSGKRVFITSQTYTANLGGTAGADNNCQTRANAAGLGGSWKAWISDPSSSPAARFTQMSSAYTLINGTLIANGWSDLTDGSIANPINRDEFDNPVASGAAWSNTNINGTFNTSSYAGCGGSVCNGWTLDNSCYNPNCGQLGDGSSTGSYWTIGGASCCNQYFRLFCFEQ